MRTFLRSIVPVLVFAAVIPFSGAAAPAAIDSPGWLGVRFAQPAAASTAGSGVLVQGIIEGSPADDAHLRAKDTILAVDGTRVGGSAELVKLVSAMEPGTVVTLSVRRGEHEFELRPVLTKRPESFKLVRGWLGLKAIELPSSLREHFGAPADAGVLVSAVTEPSPAFDAGIRVGDVIYEADAKPVTSVQALASLASEAGIDNVMDVVLARDGARIVVGPRIQRAPEPGD